MKNESKGFVSVILPTYNRASVIERAISSVLGQTYSDLELIIVDDGSTDDTKVIVNQFQDKRIKFKRSSVNRGASAARNVGIRSAKGEYIAFQDSDDEWFPYKLEKQVKVLEGHGREWGLVYSMFSKEMPTGYVEFPPLSIPIEKKCGDMFETLLHGNYIGTPTMLVRRETIETVGGFDENLRNLEDYELVLRISKKYKIEIVEEVLTKAYVLNDGIDKNPIYTIFSVLLIEKKFRQELIVHNAHKEFMEGIIEYGKQFGLERQLTALLSQ